MSLEIVACKYVGHASLHWNFLLNMSSDTKECKRFGVLVCEDSEKWGGTDYIGKRFKSLLAREGEHQWVWFNVCAGDLPRENDLDKFQGFVISGSHYSANDDKEWIKQTEKLIETLSRKPTSPRLVGVCFGHQLIAKALGGVVGRNPSGKFVLQTEKVKATKDNIIVSKLFENGSLTVLESHSECVTKLPPNAESIATSNSCEHEIILFTENILGVQCHSECTGEEFEEKILPSLVSNKLLTEEEGVTVQESLRVPVQSKELNSVLSEFLHKDQ